MVNEGDDNKELVDFFEEMFHSYNKSMCKCL